MSTSAAISLPDPLWRRLAAWANERFPLENGVVVALVTALAVWFGRALTHAGALQLKPIDGAAFVAAWAYFLLLRVLDEHKDYDRDLYNHPRRVLQSGRIELRHLKVLGALAVTIQLAVSVTAGGRVVALWLVLIAWTLLMAKEFFVPWPPERFVLYAFMHMISMPLTFLWLAQIGAGGAGLGAATRWLVVLGAFLGAAMEVARKFKAPADERATIDSYTGQLGVRGASAALAVILIAAAGLAAGLIASTTAVAAPVYAALAVSVVPGAVAAFRFAARPTAARAEQVEALAGVSVLLLVSIAVAALLISRGVL